MTLLSLLTLLPLTLPLVTTTAIPKRTDPNEIPGAIAAGMQFCVYSGDNGCTEPAKWPAVGGCTPITRYGQRASPSIWGFLEPGAAAPHIDYWIMTHRELADNEQIEYFNNDTASTSIVARSATNDTCYSMTKDILKNVNAIAITKVNTGVLPPS